MNAAKNMTYDSNTSKNHRESQVSLKYSADKQQLKFYKQKIATSF
jgi:hypothetical protein